MFDNPRPSFFAAMYKCGPPPPPPPLDAQTARPSTTGNDSHGIGPRTARDPGHGSPVSPHTGEIKKDGRETPGADEADPRKTAGFSTGVKGSAFTPATDTIGRKGAGGQVIDDADTPYFRECGVVFSSSDNSRRGAAVVVSGVEDSQHCSSESPSVGSEIGVAQPISRDLLPKLMESLHLEGRSRTPLPAACNGGGHVQPALSVGSACSDINTAAGVSACEEQQNAGTPKNQARVSDKQDEGGAEDDDVADRSPDWDEETQQPVADFVDTLQRADPMGGVVLSQLSAQLNATRIEDENSEGSDSTFEGRERNLSSAKSDLIIGAVGVTNAKDRPFDRDRNGGSSVTDEDERLPCTLCKENSGIMAGVTVLEYDDDDDRSPPEDPRQEHKAQEDDNSRVLVHDESLELLRLGSGSQSADGSSHRDRSFDRGSLGEVGVSRTCSGGDDSNDATMFPLAQSPDAAPIVGEGEGESHVFGSMPSLDIGGFGRLEGCDDGVHALSPFALAVSFEDCSGEDAGGDKGSDGGGGGGGGWDLSPSGVGGNCCGLSPVSSARSESTIDPDGGGPSPSQRGKVLFVDDAGESEEDDEDITLTPEISRSSRLSDDQPLFPTSTGGNMKENEEVGGCERGNLDTRAAGIEEGGSGVMPPPPPRQPSLARRRGQRQPETPEDRRSPSGTLRRSAALSDRTNTPTGRYGGEQSGDEASLSCHAGAKCYGGDGGGGGDDFDKQVSIGSFSESEEEGSRLGGSICEGGGGEDKENADGSSLVEGTPRRGRTSPVENQGGFYPPLQVRNTFFVMMVSGWSFLSSPVVVQ